MATKLRQSLCEMLLLLFLCLLVAVPGEASDSLWNYELRDYSDHPCNRPCHDYTTPRLCQYEFVLEDYYVLSKACHDCPFNQSHCFLPHCVTAGGFRRAIKTVNRKLPGPAIEVCEGDTVEVKVTNALSAEGTSIHWHGILQRNSQHMDGTPFVTQCPILKNSYFTYRFLAEDVGTYFWHSHSGTQRSDGLFGALIVRQRPSRDPHYNLYDYDLSEHIVFVSDWLPVTAGDRLAELVHIRENLDLFLLINGMGAYKEHVSATTNEKFYTPRATFTVSPDKRYRFRVISSGILNCPLEFSIDGHKITVIASDGSPVDPIVREAFTIYAGERYDFVLHANNTSKLRNFWIRVRGLHKCAESNATQAAILKYEGAPDVPPPESLSLNGNNNDPDDENKKEKPIGQELLSVASGDDIVHGRPDKKIYIVVDMVQIENLMSYHPVYYPLKTSALYESAQMNYITSLLPPSPPLTQHEDLPEELFCNTETVQKQCRKEWCACVHRYQVNLGDLVELVILDDESTHPLHLHGHKFRVIGTGELKSGTTIEDLQQMDNRGELNRTTTRAPFKDTFAAPVDGYHILRFKADNPGFWIFHCHIEFDADAGMLLVFQVGNATEIPPRPKNFPTCGKWEETED